jgi:hypothetical protein
MSRSWHTRSVRLIGKCRRKDDRLDAMTLGVRNQRTKDRNRNDYRRQVRRAGNLGVVVLGEALSRQGFAEAELGG